MCLVTFQHWSKCFNKIKILILPSRPWNAFSKIKYHTVRVLNAGALMSPVQLLKLSHYYEAVVLTCVLRAKLVLQQRSSDQPASPLSEWFPQHMLWTLWKPVNWNISAKLLYLRSTGLCDPDFFFLKILTCWVSSLVGNTAKARTSHTTRSINTW